MEVHAAGLQMVEFVVEVEVESVVEVEEVGEMEEVEEVERKDVGDEVERVVEKGGTDSDAAAVGSGIGAGDGTGTNGAEGSCCWCRAALCLPR